MTNPVTILTGNPTIEVIAEQALHEPGILSMANWVKAHRPDCVPETGFDSVWDLLPHDIRDEPHENDHPHGHAGQRELSANEILCEIAGRKCYDSFAEKAGKKTNRDYFTHIVSMDPLHASIMYHAKMTFFFAGVSRKFSHQFIRNYVGSDREEEGSPSQESTRFTRHYGFFVAPPLICNQPPELYHFELECQSNYDVYNNFIQRQRDRLGGKPTTAQRKDILEAAIAMMGWSFETSFIWTTNPIAIRKFLKERCHEAADAEISRFAIQLGRLCFARWPNLFLGRDLDAVREACQ